MYRLSSLRRSATGVSPAPPALTTCSASGASVLMLHHADLLFLEAGLGVAPSFSGYEPDVALVYLPASVFPGPRAGTRTQNFRL